MSNPLAPGSTGIDVMAWQRIIGSTADGLFGPLTERATRIWQGAHGLAMTGRVGDLEWACEAAKAEPSEHLRALSKGEKVAAFGYFQFRAAPTATDPEAITITDSWARNNVVSVHLQQLRGIVGAPDSCRIQWHKRATSQLLDLWLAWEAAGLLPLVKTWAGSWCPRFVRGSRTNLSSHAWATAFDINAGWNPRGHAPAGIGSRGSVRELVPLAERHGFAWGGYWDVPDGMHFEVSRLEAE
jgi:hypothetical protein